MFMLRAILLAVEVAFNLVCCQDLISKLQNGNVKDVLHSLQNVSIDIINGVDKEGISLLYAALDMKEEGVVDALLKNGVCPNSPIKDKQPLFVAIEKRLENCVKALLRRQVDVNATNSSMDTALHKAVVKRDYKVVKWLLNKGARNVKNNAGMTPLHLAAKYFHVNVVYALLKNGANVNDVDCLGFTPLHYAVNNNDVAATRYFIKNKSDIEAKTGLNCTPLHMAAKSGNEIMARLLVDSGANLETRNSNGETALHVAIRSWHPPMVKFLASRGAKLEVENDFGETPFEMATYRPIEIIVHMLCEAGCDYSYKHNPEYVFKRYFHTYHTTSKTAILSEFDDYLLHIVSRYLEKSPPKWDGQNVEDLIKCFDGFYIFALYRVFKSCYVKDSEKRQSMQLSFLEDRKLKIFDAILMTLCKQTYMEVVPMEVIEDMFYHSMYGWKMERLAWFVTLASYNLEFTQKECETLALKLMPKYL